MPPKGSTRARTICEAPRSVGRQRKKQSTTAPPPEPAAVPTPDKQQDFLQISKTGGVNPNRVEPATRSTTRQTQLDPPTQSGPSAQSNPPFQPTRVRINQQAPPKPNKKPLPTPLVDIEGNLKLDGAWNLRCYEYKYVTECLQLHRFPTDSTPTSKERSPEDSGKTESNQIVMPGGFLTKKNADGEPGTSGCGGGARGASHARDDEAGVLAGFVVEQDIAATEGDPEGQPDGASVEPESEERVEYVVKTAGVKPSGGGRLSRLQVNVAPAATVQEGSSEAVEEAGVAEDDVVNAVEDPDVVVKVEDEAEEDDEEEGSTASARTGSIQPASPEEESREGSFAENMSQLGGSIKEESMEYDESEDDTAVESRRPPSRPRAQQTSTQAAEPQQKRDSAFSKMLQGAFGSGHPLKKAQATEQPKNTSPLKRKWSTLDAAATEKDGSTEVTDVSGVHGSFIRRSVARRLHISEEDMSGTTAGVETEEKEDDEESVEEESPAVLPKKRKRPSRGRGGGGRGRGVKRAK